MGVISTAKVVIGSKQSIRPVTIQPRNCKQVIAIKCINSSSQALPLMIIFNSKVHISTQYTDELPNDQTIAVSENGWTNDSLGLIWLTDVFQKYTKDRTKGVYQLLILDRYRSHSTPQFDQFYIEHLIITLYMPLHSLHLLQPLDVSCFTVLKRSYRQQIKELMQARYNHIEKPDFLTAYTIACIESITPNIIYSGFAAIGLVLYNPKRVLSKLNT